MISPPPPMRPCGADHSSEPGRTEKLGDGKHREGYLKILRVQVRTARHLENWLQNNWCAVNSLFRTASCPEWLWRRLAPCRRGKEFDDLRIEGAPKSLKYSNGRIF
jgi:hypothetical protein